MKRTRLLFALVPLVLLGGCAASNVNQNYGQAYEQMVREQTFDVSTRDTGQGNRVVEGTDPNVANAAVMSMRKDSGKRADILSSFSAATSSQSSGSSGSGNTGN
ncbi:MAG: hypothetical protein ACRD3Q_21815 [Terriglobales bacterium]